MKTRVLCSSIFCSRKTQPVTTWSAFVRFQWHRVYSTHLHGRLSGKGVDDRAELIHAGSMGDRLPGVLGLARKTEGLGAVEGDRGTGLLVSVRVGALEGSLLRGLSLGVDRRGCRERDDDASARPSLVGQSRSSSTTPAADAAAGTTSSAFPSAQHDARHGHHAVNLRACSVF